MKIFKFLSSVVSMSSFLILGILVHVTQPANAYKLELQDNGMVLVLDSGKVVGKVNRDTLKSENDVTLPDTLSINEIVLSYAGKHKDTLKVVSNNQVSFQAVVQNSLNDQEISKANGLTIVSGQKYMMSHGPKSWSLYIVGKPDSTSVEKTDKPDKSGATAGPNNTNNKDTGMNIAFMAIICCLVVLVLGIAAYILINRFRKSKIDSGSDIHSGSLASDKFQNADGKNNNEEKTSTGSNSGTLESLNAKAEDSANRRTDKDDDSKKENKEYSNNDAKSADAELDMADFKTIKSLLDHLVPDLSTLSDAQKIKTLRIALDTCKSEGSILRKVQNELCMEDDSVMNESAILDKIRDLKSKNSQVSPQQEMEIRAQYAQELLDKMTSKKDKTLTGLVDKAKKESQGSPIDALDKLIKILPSALRNASVDSYDNKDSKLITDSQLNNTENLPKIKRWFISQIELSGYAGLNPNRTKKELFDEIANALNNCANHGEPVSEEEIVTAAIVDDKLTNEQKKVLVRRIIEKVNSFVGNDSNKLNESASLDEFGKTVASKLETPTSYDDAITRERESNLNVVSEAVECEVKDFNKNTLINALKQLIVKLVNRKIDGFGVDVENDNYEDAYKEVFNKLSDLVKQSQKEAILLGEYQITSIQELPEAIEKRKDDNILKSVDKKVGEFLPDKPITSIQQLVNALFKLAEDAKREVMDADERESMIADDIEEKIASRDSSYRPVEGMSVLQLVDKFNALVKKNEDKLTGEIREQQASIGSLNETIEEKDHKISGIEAKNNALMSESKIIVENVHILADNVLQSCKTILNPCSEADESQCMDIEDRLYASLNASMKRLKSIQISNEEFPADMRKRIQDTLIEELSAPDSPIQLVCRYYAYSRLPFMTDTSREYGVIFNRKNMSELYMAVDNLYVYFGIRFDLPHLFVMGLEEGEFENLTGESYSDLDNLCSNSRNHFDNIDSNTKPSNVIVDMVSVGYSVDGKSVKKTAVLTY